MAAVIRMLTPLSCAYVPAHTPLSCAYVPAHTLCRPIESSSSSICGPRHSGVRTSAVQLGTWVEGGSSTITVQVPAPVAFNIIAAYERWPEWSPWLSSVDTIEPDAQGATSQWHLKFQAVDVNWNSRVVERVPDKKLRWESTSGIRNSGTLESTPGSDPFSSVVSVSVRYEIPTLLEKLLSTRFIANLVSRRLKADLVRFRAIAEQEYSLPSGTSE